MTEQEAKTKWCPMVRVHFSGYGQDEHYSNNRLELRNTTRCIASDCMLWRWARHNSKRMTHWDCAHSETCRVKDNLKKDDALDCDVCPDCEALIIRHLEDVPGQGYCGLGGVP